MRNVTDQAAARTPKLESPFNPSRQRFEDCEHIVRPDDVDRALCGIDQTDVPWNQGLPVCQACLAVAQGRLS